MRQKNELEQKPTSLSVRLLTLKWSSTQIMLKRGTNLCSLLYRGIMPEYCNLPLIIFGYAES